MFHEEENDFVVNRSSGTVPEIKDNYLRPSNIDEPATFAIMDD